MFALLKKILYLHTIEPIFIQLENLKSNFMYKHYPYLEEKKNKLKGVIRY